MSAKKSHNRKSRSLRHEGLETRQMMTADTDFSAGFRSSIETMSDPPAEVSSSLQSAGRTTDVNLDGHTNARDALCVATYLLRAGSHSTDSTNRQFDVNGDQTVDQADFFVIRDEMLAGLKANRESAGSESGGERNGQPLIECHAPKLGHIADSLVTQSGTSIAIKLSGTDGDGVQLTYKAEVGALLGSFLSTSTQWSRDEDPPADLIVSDGQLTITPHDDFAGHFQVYIAASDGKASDWKVVTVYVTGVRADRTIPQGGALTVDVPVDVTPLSLKAQVVMPDGTTAPATVEMKKDWRSYDHEYFAYHQNWHLEVTPRPDFVGKFSVEILDVSLQDCPASVVKTLTFEVVASDNVTPSAADQSNVHARSTSANAVPIVPSAVNNNVDYIYSNQFNSRSEYELRPTLLVLTHGASFGKAFQNGAGYTEDDGWTYALANNLAHDLNEAGSQVHIMRVDWASLANNTSQSRQVADHIRDFLGRRATEWDVVLVGHSRGAIFNQEVANELGQPGNLHSLQHVMLDPTAAVSMGDDYPSSVPGNVDRAVVYDDGYQLFPLGVVRDGIEIAGADYRRVKAPGTDYSNSHGELAVVFAEEWYKNDLSWKLHSKERQETPFAKEGGVGYEEVITRAPDEANKIIDIGFDPNRNGDAHGFISILGIGGGDLTIGKSGLAVSGGLTYLGGGGFSVNKDHLAINYSNNIGLVGVGGGLIITSEETQLDLDAGPLRIAMFGEGAGIYFGGNKISFKESLSSVAGTVRFEQIKSSGERITQEFVNGLETVREELFKDGRKVITTFVGGLSKVTEWASIPSDPAELANTLSNLSMDDMASAVRGLPVDKLAEAVRHLGDKAQEVLSVLGVNTVADVLNRIDGSTLTGTLGKMSVPQVAELLQKVNVHTLDAALHGLSLSRVADVLEKCDGETLQRALKQLDVDRAASVLEKVDNGTLEEAFKGMSKSLAANVLERVNASTLNVVLKKIDVGRAADILERVDGSTLKTAFKHMSTSLAANVLERVDTGTLKAALKRLSAGEVADLLNKVDARTLKHALDAIDGDKLNNVLKDVSKQVSKTAESYLKKADPGKLATAFKGISSGASSAGSKISKALGL